MKEVQTDIFTAGLVPDKLGHGGKRANSGRKRLEPTVAIRVDADLAQTFKDISEQYRVISSGQEDIKLKLKQIMDGECT